MAATVGVWQFCHNAALVVQVSAASASLQDQAEVLTRAVAAFRIGEAAEGGRLARVQVTAAPSLFGQSFQGPMAGHVPGMPWHYDLHVWAWSENPAGRFAQWNPTLSCGM